MGENQKWQNDMGYVYISFCRGALGGRIDLPQGPSSSGNLQPGCGSGLRKFTARSSERAQFQGQVKVAAGFFLDLSRSGGISDMFPLASSERIAFSMVSEEGRSQSTFRQQKTTYARNFLGWFLYP